MTVKLGKYHPSHYLLCEFTFPFTEEEYQEWWTYTTTWIKLYRPKLFSSFEAQMALAPKLSNTQVLEQLGKYSLYKQKFWICSSFLASLCVILLLYKPTLNGLLERYCPLHIHHETDEGQNKLHEVTFTCFLLNVPSLTPDVYKK